MHPSTPKLAAQAECARSGELPTATTATSASCARRSRWRAPMLGLTSPNPAVGCVIVRDDRDRRPRRDRAPAAVRMRETVALADAGGRARGATAYVSLEPCAHQGQTPPCARALIEAGIARVVVGCRDPYPPVRGRGIAILRAAGVDVIEGVLEDECRRLNEGFIHARDARTPVRHAQAGCHARRTYRSRRWRFAMDQFARVARAGPSMAPRGRRRDGRRRDRDRRQSAPDLPHCGRTRSGARDHRWALAIAREGKVFRQRSSAPTILVTTPANRSRAELKRRYEARRSIVEIVTAKSTAGKIDLGALMREFGRRGWSKVLLEGGAHLAGAALAAGIVDRVALFLAPTILARACRRSRV